MKGRNFAKSIGMIMGIVLLTWCFNLPKAFSGPVPGVTDDTILIGVPAPLSGPAALFAKQAADFPESVFLEWGKNIHGRNIKLIKADEGCDSVKAVAAVKKLINVDKVFLLNGPACSSSILASKPIIAQEGT
jgi:ABC-type branched-subunit amino acid transport system substrate-binding protein